MIRSERIRYRPAGIMARALNILILICAALIVLALIWLVFASRARNELAEILPGIALAVLFGVLDFLVVLRLSPPTIALATRRLTPGSAGQLLLAAMTVVALSVSVVVFFFGTCQALALAAGLR
jgi:hypothetical protein